MSRLEEQPRAENNTIPTAIDLVHIKEGKILLVRNGEGEFWFLPGGKLEQGESDKECLEREVREELDVCLGGINFYGEFEGITPYSKRPLCVFVYLGEINGDPKASAEIVEVEWTEKPWDKNLTDITREIVDKLREEGAFLTGG